MNEQNRTLQSGALLAYDKHSSNGSPVKNLIQSIANITIPNISRLLITLLTNTIIYEENPHWLFGFAFSTYTVADDKPAIWINSHVVVSKIADNVVDGAYINWLGISFS